MAQETFKSESDKWRAVRACVPYVPYMHYLIIDNATN